MTAAAVLIQSVLDVCPGLDEGALDALVVLGPDLSDVEWAARLGAPAWVIRRAATVLRVQIREEA